MIFVGQTALKIELELYEIVNGAKTPIDLTGASVVLRKEDGTNLGPFTITDAVEGKIEWEPDDANTLAQGGDYCVQPEVTFADSKTAKGERFVFRVHK